MKLLCILPLLAVIVISGCTATDNRTTPVTSDIIIQPCTDTPAPPSDTLPYTGPETGYTFSYPSTWTEDNGWSIEYYLQSALHRRSDPYAQISVYPDSILSDTVTTLDQVTSLYLSKIRDVSVSFTICSTTLAGQPARQVTYEEIFDAESPDLMKNRELWALQGSDRVLKVAFRTLSPDFDTYLPEAQAVITSLAFTS